MFDLEAHLKRQMAFSHATFGPGERMQGVLDHIRKEIVEVEQSNGDSNEWVDIVILALDGLTRRLSYCVDGKTRNNAQEVAAMACRMIEGKQTRNEERVWPDWRTADPNKAITHVKKTKESMRDNLLRRFPVPLDPKAWPQYTSYHISRNWISNSYSIRERIFNNPNEVDYNIIGDITKEEARYLIDNNLLKTRDDKVLEALGYKIDES